MSIGKRIRTALDTEFGGAVPSSAVWERIKETTPAQTPRRHRLSSLAAAAIWGLVVLTGSVAVAATPQVQAWIDHYFAKTGIKLVENAPLPAGVKPTPLEPAEITQLRTIVPEGMKLPAYLPAPLNGPDAQASTHESAYTYGVLWHGSGNSPFIYLSRYKIMADGESVVNGLQAVQDVTINGVHTAAYQDGADWNIVLFIDGFQYKLQAHEFSLSEAVKVAESLK